MSSDFETSVGMKTALPPACLISSTVSSPGCCLRAAMATAAPSLANAIAVALPIPELPPVTIATLSTKRFIRSLGRHYYPCEFQNGMRLIHASQNVPIHPIQFANLEIEPCTVTSRQVVSTGFFT